MRAMTWIWLAGLALGCTEYKTGDSGDSGVSDEADADTDTDTDADTDTDTDTDIDGSLIITSPDDGDEIEGTTISITFSVDGCVFGPPSSAPDGCHLHKYIDGVAYEDPVEGGGFGHYDTGGFDIIVGSTGEHEVGIILIRNDGSDQPFSPPVSDSVTVTLVDPVVDTGGGGDTGGGDDTGTSGGDDTGASGGDDTGGGGDDTGGGVDDTGLGGGDTGETMSGTTGVEFEDVDPEG